LHQSNISLLRYNSDIYDTQKQKKGEPHYTEEFKCHCSKKCDFSYKVVVTVKSSVADIFFKGKLHFEKGWKQDETKIMIDQRILRMIRESSLGIKIMTPSQIFKEKEKIREQLKLELSHGAFYISIDQIGQKIYSKRFQ